MSRVDPPASVYYSCISGRREQNVLRQMHTFYLRRQQRSPQVSFPNEQRYPTVLLWPSSCTRGGLRVNNYSFSHTFVFVLRRELRSSGTPQNWRTLAIVVAVYVCHIILRWVSFSALMWERVLFGAWPWTREERPSSKHANQFTWSIQHPTRLRSIQKKSGRPSKILWSRFFVRVLYERKMLIRWLSRANEVRSCCGPGKRGNQ